jgi:ferredoxin
MSLMLKSRAALRLLSRCKKNECIIGVCSVWINVVPPDGVPRRVAGFSGESLLDVIQRNKIPGIFADCNGGDNELKPYQIPVDFFTSGVSCAQCSIVIPDPWYDKCNKTLSFEQTRMLRNNAAQSSNSRLACCIQVRAELNEMICVVGNNRSTGGEFFTGHDPDAF